MTCTCATARGTPARRLLALLPLLLLAWRANALPHSPFAQAVLAEDNALLQSYHTRDLSNRTSVYALLAAVSKATAETPG